MASLSLFVVTICLFQIAASMPSDYVDGLFLDESIEDFDYGITGANDTNPDQPSRVVPLVTESPKGTPGKADRAMVIDPDETKSPSENTVIEDKPASGEDKKDSVRKSGEITDEMITLLSLSGAGGLTIIVFIVRFIYRAYTDGVLAINFADQAWDRVQEIIARIRFPRVGGRLAIGAP